VRQALAINTEACRNQWPCLVAAYYDAEADDAIPADCYAFLQDYARSVLFLRPGKYRLRATNMDGRILSDRPIVVSGQ
jgi:hypothetical protein